MSKIRPKSELKNIENDKMIFKVSDSSRKNCEIDFDYLLKAQKLEHKFKFSLEYYDLEGL